jgi:hypothetical protein
MQQSPVKKGAQGKNIRISKRRLRRAFRLGCLPAAVIGPLALTGLLIAVFLRQAPFWVGTPQQYLFVQRFDTGLAVLLICQLAAHWLLGLMAASGGASAIGEQVSLRPRLIAVRRRLLIPTLAVFALRLLLLIWVVGAGVVVYLSGLILPDAVRAQAAFIRLDRTTTILALGVMAVFAAYWLIGPFLWTRSSVALGALGAALTPDRKSRRWMAASARLGVELAQLLLIAWGVGLVVLILATADDPYYYYMGSYAPPSPPSSWPGWEWFLRHRLSYLAAGAGILFTAALQYGLSWVYRWAVPLALRLRRRLEW